MKFEHYLSAVAYCREHKISPKRIKRAGFRDWTTPRASA